VKIHNNALLIVLKERLTILTTVLMLLMILIEAHVFLVKNSEVSVTQMMELILGATQKWSFVKMQE